jgi:hypothetical protein
VAPAAAAPLAGGAARQPLRPRRAASRPPPLLQAAARSSVRSLTGTTEGNEEFHSIGDEGPPVRVHPIRTNQSIEE